jgi:hypothetical protein
MEINTAAIIRYPVLAAARIFAKHLLAKNFFRLVNKKFTILFCTKPRLLGIIPFRSN